MAILALRSRLKNRKVADSSAVGKSLKVFDEDHGIRRPSVMPILEEETTTGGSHSSESTATKESEEEAFSQSGSDKQAARVGSLFAQEKKWSGIDDKIGPFLRKGALVALGFWLLGVTLVYTMAPADSFENLQDSERNANVAVLIILLYTNVSRLLHLVIRDKSLVFLNTGVVIGAMTVQILAMVSISLMIFFPTPVLVDQVTGLRTHLIRWVEWVVLAFLMTFLTESIDIPLNHSNKDLRYAWLHGIAIGLSTSAGGLFPFCGSWAAWLTVFTIAWVLFCSLYVRLYQRYRRLMSMPKEGSVGVKEEYDRAKYSFKTIAVCAVVWTLLAITFSVIAMLKPLAPPGSFFANDSLVLVSESCFEVISKVWYLNLLIEVHSIVFDDASRTMRRLEELRIFMSTVWNASSDVMVWCSAGEKDSIHAVVSPSFFDLGNNPSADRESSSSGKRPTLILELDSKRGSYSYRVFNMDLSSTVTRQDAMDLMFSATNTDKSELTDNPTRKNVAILASLLMDVFESERKEFVVMKDLHGTADDGGSEDVTLRCEAKVSKLDSNSLIILRDISERFHRFEAEKKLVAEITARTKDAEANRFTRHEVKNSILAAIGVLESMRGTTATSSSPNPGLEGTLERVDSENTMSRSSGTVNCDSSVLAGSEELDTMIFDDHVGELDNTLRTVLDTIMDHTMSREVINEEYVMRKERVMIPDLLSNIHGKADRFSLVSRPAKFPILGMDPRLLRYIYQNALSNASRYGKRDGQIDTIVSHDNAKKQFRMKVVNLPGLGHEELLALGHDEVQHKVFSPGTRLPQEIIEEHEMSVKNSSGDGAWIMKKCIGILKGECDLRFEPDRTVFSFSCPVKAFNTTEYVGPTLTCLPDNTWGVAIDDSGIQRKLMDRYLKIAGIQKEKRIIVGKDDKEIYGFNDMIVELVRQNPDDKFLIIADENLDVLEGAALHGTVSGSLCLQKILERLELDDSARLLALVRSANDSSRDTDLYKARAHGYLVKAPMHKNGVLALIQPYWFKRFPSGDKENSTSLASHDNGSLDVEEDYDPFYDIKGTLEILDALCMTSGTSLKIRWRSIRDRLHALKGDLKSTIHRDDADLKSLVDAIGKLKNNGCTDQLKNNWCRLHQQITKVLDAQHAKYTG